MESVSARIGPVSRATGGVMVIQIVQINPMNKTVVSVRKMAFTFVDVHFITIPHTKYM